MPWKAIPLLLLLAGPARAEEGAEAGGSTGEEGVTAGGEAGTAGGTGPRAGEGAGATAGDAAGEEAPAWDEEVVVEEERVRRARARLLRGLDELGYELRTQRGGRLVFQPEERWKPWVVVDEEGWVRIRRAPVTLGPPELPGALGGPLGLPLCVLVPTACIHYQGALVSPRKLQPQKARVAEALAPALREWQEALSERAMRQRVEVELPAALEALWERGEPLYGEGPPLPSPAARRAAIADYWLSRTGDPWGQRARRVIADFVQAVVQQGPAPYTTAELCALAERCGCAPFGIELPGPGEAGPRP